jgi:hypothetical protein
VTRVEYGDYECPYCGAAHPIVKAIQAIEGRRLDVMHGSASVQVSRSILSSQEAKMTRNFMITLVTVLSLTGCVIVPAGHYHSWHDADRYHHYWPEYRR